MQNVAANTNSDMSYPSLICRAKQVFHGLLAHGCRAGRGNFCLSRPTALTKIQEAFNEAIVARDSAIASDDQVLGMLECLALGPITENLLQAKGGHTDDLDPVGHLLPHQRHAEADRELHQAQALPDGTSLEICITSASAPAKNFLVKAASTKGALTRERQAGSTGAA